MHKNYIPIRIKFINLLQFNQKSVMKQFMSRSTFNPAGVIHFIFWIHCVSFCDTALLMCLPLQWGSILSIPQNFNLLGSLLWYSLKWLERLCWRNPFRMFFTCSLSRILSCLVVRPTYWYPHSHSNRYVTWVLWQDINCAISNLWVVVFDLNSLMVRLLSNLLHALHALHLPHL